MAVFNFNRQKATALYREWFVKSKKSYKSNYDKEQVDGLRNYLSSELNHLFRQYIKGGLKIYRAEIPILYIREKKLEIFTNQVLVIGKTIRSLNMPGCIATGNSIEEAYDNYLNAVIECTDARYKNGLKFMNIVHTMHFYDPRQIDLPAYVLLKELKDAGWIKEYKGIYNTILLKEGSKVTFTVPNGKIISSSMLFYYRKLLYNISKQTEKIMYMEIQDDSYWSCDICGGNETTGCLYFDPTECPNIK